LFEEIAVEAPADRIGGGGAESSFVKKPVISLIEEVKDGIFVKDQIGFARGGAGEQAVAQGFDQGTEAFENAPDVEARAFGMVDGLAPDGLAFDEIGAKGGSFEVVMFGKERVTISEIGDDSKEGALRSRK
jgi:hypothetical protein